MPAIRPQPNDREDLLPSRVTLAQFELVCGFGELLVAECQGVDRRGGRFVTAEMGGVDIDVVNVGVGGGEADDDPGVLAQLSGTTRVRGKGDCLR